MNKGESGLWAFIKILGAISRVPHTLEFWEGVQSPDEQQEEEHVVVQHVQVEHYQTYSVDR